MARALALSLIVLTACSGGKTADPASAPATSPVTGLITELERSDGAIGAVTLDVEGTTYRFLVDPERDYGFDLNHLDEHVSGKLPVSVSFETRPDGLYATAIDDA